MSHILFKKSKIEEKKKPAKSKNMKTCDLGKKNQGMPLDYQFKRISPGKS